MVCAITFPVPSALSPNVYLTFLEPLSRKQDYCLQEPLSINKEEKLNDSFLI